MDKIESFFISNGKLPYSIMFLMFSIFTFLGLVPNSLYPSVLEAIFVYSMFFIFVGIFGCGIYGHCKGWSDPSCPKPKRIRKTKKINVLSNNIVQLNEKNYNNNQTISFDDLEDGSTKVDNNNNLLSYKNYCLKYCIPSCLKKKFPSIHPEEHQPLSSPKQNEMNKNKKQLDQQNSGSFQKCRELKYGRPDTKQATGCLHDLYEFIEYLKLICIEIKNMIWSSNSSPISPETEPNFSTSQTTTSSNYQSQSSNSNSSFNNENNSRKKEEVVMEVTMMELVTPQSVSNNNQSSLKDKGEEKIIKMKSLSNQDDVKDNNNLLSISPKSMKKGETDQTPSSFVVNNTISSQQENLLEELQQKPVMNVKPEDVVTTSASNNNNNNDDVQTNSSNDFKGLLDETAGGLGTSAKDDKNKDSDKDHDVVDDDACLIQIEPLDHVQLTDIEHVTEHI